MYPKITDKQWEVIENLPLSVTWYLYTLIILAGFFTFIVPVVIVLLL